MKTDAVSWDVFLAHNSKDNAEIERIAIQLIDLNVNPFLDSWYLTPGMPWQTELEQAIGNSKTVAIFIGQHETGPWHHREMQLALQAKADGCVIPVLLPGAKNEDVPKFLALLTIVDLSNRDEHGLKRLVAAIRNESLPSPSRQRRLQDKRRRRIPGATEVSGWLIRGALSILYRWMGPSESLPLESAAEYFFNGSDSVLTGNTVENPLLSHPIVAVFQTAAKRATSERHGLIGEGVVRNTNSNAPVSLNRYVVEITKFVSISKCRRMGESRGAADAIEASFLLEDKANAPFPWCFDAEEVVLKSSGHTHKLDTPYNVTGSDLVALRYFINAKNPGIYYVQCVTYVLARGGTTPVRIPLHSEPIPIAFYEIDESPSAATQDWVQIPQRE